MRIHFHFSIDKVATVPTVRSRKADTSAPMEIGMASKDDGESVREEDQRIVDRALQAVYKRTGKGTWSFGKGQNWSGWQRWQRRRKESMAKWQQQERQQRARERWQGRMQNLMGVWKSRTHSSVVS